MDSFNWAGAELSGEFLIKPSQLSKVEFIEYFGGVYEHSQWVVDRVWQQSGPISKKFDQRESLAILLKEVVDESDRDTKLRLLRAHPDLAGKAARAGEVTTDSTEEQSGAGLDQCTESEFSRFNEYNQSYQSRFGFPFIMAVKGANKEDIFLNFENRITNTLEEEFNMAMQQVHRIARFRLAVK